MVILKLDYRSKRRSIDSRAIREGIEVETTARTVSMFN